MIATQADAEGEEHRPGHLRPVARERRRVDEVLGEPDREEADRDQRDAEERVDRRDVRAARPFLDREAEHEVGRVEEEEDEEEDELVRVPDPPVAPRRLRPDRAGGERERAEDRSQVDRRRSSRGRSAPRASRAAAAPSRRPSRSRRRRSARSARGSRRSAARCPGRRPPARRRTRGRSRARRGRQRPLRAPERESSRPSYSETTYSKDAQHSIAKTASYSPRNAR